MHWRGGVLVCRLRLRPCGGRDAFAGRIGDRLRIRVSAPPVGGKANAALVRFLAGQCQVSRSRVRVVAGAFDRDKVVEIDRPSVIPGEILSFMRSSAQE